MRMIPGIGRGWIGGALLAALVVGGCGGGGSGSVEAVKEEQNRDDALRMSLYKGREYLKRDKNEQALAALRRAAELEPENGQVWADLGLVYTRLGQYAPALIALNRANRLDPDNPEVMNRLAVALMRNARHGEAETVLQSALGRVQQPHIRADILYNLSLIQQEQGKEEEMIATLEEVLITRPNHVPALIKLADHHHAHQRLDREQEYLSMALIERGDDIGLLDRMITLLVQGGHTNQAVPLMKRLVNLAPESAEGMRASRKLKLLLGDGSGGMGR